LNQILLVRKVHLPQEPETAKLYLNPQKNEEYKTSYSSFAFGLEYISVSGKNRNGKFRDEILHNLAPVYGD
jgi:hypothetical protein